MQNILQELRKKQKRKLGMVDCVKNGVNYNETLKNS